MDEAIHRAARAIASADALLIGAGAGMGVDSGLPDFRGPQGFWRAYPPYARLGLDFPALANPRWFASDPAFGWGFYGHRMNLYRATEPHEGFGILRRWADRMPAGHFVFTSNVDGHFPRSGFDPDRVVEVHGSIHWLQCTAECGPPFPADPFAIRVDDATMRAEDPLPACPRCGFLARPNVLMFGDWDWDSARTDDQHARLRSWLATLGRARLALVECGAGEAVPTVRRACEDLAQRFRGTLIRVNPRDFDVPSAGLALPLGALDALRAIDERLGSLPG